MSIFLRERREEVKIELLEAGLDLIREKGIKKMKIEEVTERAGIGKGTFYHFYQSKEWFVYDVIQFSKENLKQTVNKIVEESGGIDRTAFLKILRRFSFSGLDNIISFMTIEDEQWLAEKLPPEYSLDSPKEEKIVAWFLGCMIGVQGEPNAYVIANIMKIMALTVENRKFLHQDVLEENLTLLAKQLCDYIYGNEKE